MHTRARPSRRFRLSVLLLGLALVIAQVALTYHRAGVDQHKAGEQCELCVVSAHFAHGATGAHALSLPILQHVIPDARAVAPIRSTFFLAYRGRAPPSPSFAFVA